jgi:hypothetical protein
LDKSGILFFAGDLRLAFPLRFCEIVNSYIKPRGEMFFPLFFSLCAGHICGPELEPSVLLFLSDACRLP